MQYNGEVSELGREIRRYREENGWTHRRMAAQVPYSYSHLANLEAGRRPGSVEVAKALDTALRTGGRFENIFQRSPKEREGDDMRRRAFLRGAGTAVAAAVVAPTAFYGGRSVPGRVDPGHIRDVRENIDRLYREDQLRGGGSLASPALHQYYDARQMLDESAYSDAVGRELMAIAGELAVCVGWLCYDSGDQRKARELYTEAYMLADQAGATHLAIQATEKMALQSVYIADRGAHQGSVREAGRLTSRVVELARYDASPRLHALVGGREAIAYAVAGQEREFRVAISRAWREIDRAGTDPESQTWLQFVNPSEVTVHEAKGYRYLNRPEKAVELYRNSLDDGSLSPRNALNYRAQLAGALVSLGDSSSALQEGVAVLTELETTIASPRTLAELSNVRTVAATACHDEFQARYDMAVSKVEA